MLQIFKKKTPSLATVMVVLVVSMLIMTQTVAAIAPLVAGAAVVGGTAVGGGGGYLIGSMGEDTEGMGAGEVEEELFRDALSYQDNVDESMVWVENEITDAEQVAIGHGQYATCQALQEDAPESVMIADTEDGVDDHYSLILENHINSWNSEVEEIHSAAQVDLATEGTDNEVYHLIHGDIVGNSDYENTDERILWTDDTEVVYEEKQLPNGDTVEMATEMQNMESPGIAAHDISVDLTAPDNPTDASVNAPEDDAYAVFQALDPEVAEYNVGEPITLSDTEDQMGIIDQIYDDSEDVANEMAVYASDIYAEYDGSDVDMMECADHL